MFGSIIQGYFLMFFVLLHLSLFVCDDTCIFPLQYCRSLLSRDAFQLVSNYVSILQIGKSTLQVMAQLLFVGDFFVVLILLLKLIGTFIKKFVFIFMSLAISAFLLRKLEVIWNDLHSICYLNHLSLSIPSCLSLALIFLFYRSNLFYF